MKEHEILVIGGGIGGLATAIALNLKGIRSTVFEKSPGHDPNGAGLALWQNATRILDEFGLLNPLSALGQSLQTSETRTPNGQRLGTVRLQKLADRFGFPSLVLLRSDLQKTLLDALPKSQVHFGKTFLRLERIQESVTAHFADGSSATGTAVVFADGIHSGARSTIFKSPELRYAGRVSWRGIAQFDRPVLSDANLEILGKGRRIGIFPLPGNTAYWYAAVNMPEAEAFRQNRSPEGVRQHFEGWTDPVSLLFEHTPMERLILTNINWSPGGIGKIALENMVLLGDAAHPMTPDLGQGACQAIEDAAVLADCLSQKSSVLEAFQAYEKLRSGRVRAIAANSYRMGRLRQMGSPVGVALRNALFRWMPEGLALRMLGQNIGRGFFTPSGAIFLSPQSVPNDNARAR